MIPPEKYYINVGRASDLKNKKDKFIYRALEIFPGFLVWTTFILMIILSWIAPFWAAIFIIAFCSYWLLRTAHFTLHLVAAYRQMKKNLNINWIEKLDELKIENCKLKINWREIYHLVILPMYKEGYGIVDSTMKALASSDYPKDKIIVVLAIEERAGKEAKEVVDKIKKEYEDKFFKFLITVHPKGIPGEIAGKGSNETWAGKEVKEKIIDVEKIPYENIIVSCFDIDTQVFPQYFSCLTFHYLTCKKPLRSSFQPIPLYLNNFWEAPFFSRLVSSMNVFWQMMQQQRPEKEITYSSHAMGFLPLVEMDFWQKNVVSEDAGIFWKAFLFYDGDYRVVPIHYPITMDAVAAASFPKTAINQYKQQRRWAGGSEGIPYLIFGCLKNKKIPFKKAFTYSFLIVEGFWAWATNAILILCLGWLPLVLNKSNFHSTVLAYNLPYITRNLMTIAMVGLFVCVIINILLAPRPKDFNLRRRFFLLVQWIFFPFGLIIFGSFPSIEAQTRLMLGKYPGFWVTEKVRKT
ncbi:MAG: glycosyltransferase family 2 protein [Candidatus Pacebacteria bacterium]|nr:glycosyltransferase family 2 protein [Candidatus Paceibacterota bacterium]